MNTAAASLAGHLPSSAGTLSHQSLYDITAIRSFRRSSPRRHDTGNSQSRTRTKVVGLCIRPIHRRQA